MILSALVLGLSPLALFQEPEETELEAAQRKVAELEAELGPEHSDVATALSDLAELLRTRGSYAEAHPLYVRSLAIWEKVHGPQHPYVALALNNLAVLLKDLGSYAEARPLYERSLAINEKALGPEHPHVAFPLNNLAELLQTQGSYAEARPLYERSLAIREKALGPEHPRVATALNNLASLLQDQGSYAEARTLVERALAIREKVLGSEHPDMALAINNLARLLQAQGSYAEARPLYERSLAIREKALGPEHPDVATALNNLARILKAQGSYAEARPLSERALAIQEKALGPEHPRVAFPLNNLARLLQVQGSYTEARPLLERSLAIFEKALGPDHPDVTLALNNLAVLLRTQGSYAEAHPLYERELSATLRHLSKNMGTMTEAERFQYLKIKTGPEPLLLNLIAMGGGREGPSEDAQWLALFDGKSLDGWTPKIRTHELGADPYQTFRVEDGLLKVGYDQYGGKFERRFGHLFHEVPLSHYLLRVEYRFVGEQLPDGPGWAHRNSGLMLHGQDPASMGRDQEFPVSIEVQILGGDGKHERSTANLCTPGTNVVMNEELNRSHCTNSSSVTCHGEEWYWVTVEVRGGEVIRHFQGEDLVLEYQQPQLDPRDAEAQPLIQGEDLILTEGTISLQSESHPIHFRRVEVQLLQP